MPRVMLSTNVVQELCAAFVAASAEPSGLVEPSGVPAMLAKTFPTASAATRQAVGEMILEQGDRDDRGRIDVSEFFEVIRSRQAELIQQQPSNGTEFSNGQSPEGEDPQVSNIVNTLSDEYIDMYRDAFIFLDGNGDGFVDREELMQCVRENVGDARFEAVRLYLDKIFDVADRDRDNMLTLTEFLSSFADGPGVIPQDVLTACVMPIRVRLTDAEICSLQESFRTIDTNHDGFIDGNELLVALTELLKPKCPEMTKQSFEDIVKMVMATADRDRDGRLNLSEFIRSFQEDQGVLPSAFVDGRAQRKPRALTRDEVLLLKDAFNTLDANHDGFVDYAEMSRALNETLGQKSGLTPDEVRDIVDFIMVTADRDQTGKLSLTHFIRNFVQHESIMQFPVVAAAEKQKQALERLQGLLDSGEVRRMVRVFDYLDSNHDGYLEHKDLHDVLYVQLRERFPEWNEEGTNRVIEAIVDGADQDADGRLSLQEFIDSFARGAGVLPPEVIHEWGETLRKTLSEKDLHAVQATFIAMDRDHDGFVSRDELKHALASALRGAYESEEELQSVTDFVFQAVHGDRDGKVSLREFIRSFEKQQGVLPVVVAPTDPQDSTQRPAAELPAASVNVDTAALSTMGTDGSSSTRSPLPPRPESPVGEQLSKSAVQQPAPINRPALSPDIGSATDREALPELISSPYTQPSHEVAPVTPPADTLSPERRQLATFDAVAAMSPIVNDISGVCLTEQQLRIEFTKYPEAGRGRIRRQALKEAYLSMEHYGLDPTEQEVDRLFARYMADRDSVSFEEFSIIMLQRSRM